GPDRAGLVRVLHRPGRARGEVRGRRVLAASPRSGRRLRAVRWCGMSWLTRAPREPSAAERAAIQAETCTACRRDDGAAMVLIPLGEFGQQWVCVHAPSCRQRAQLAGIWGAA